MWKRRISVFMVVCLLCGLVPGHAASLLTSEDSGSALVSTETALSPVKPEDSAVGELGAPSPETHPEASLDTTAAGEINGLENEPVEGDRGTSEELELGTEVAPVPVRQIAEGREEIQINTKDDLVALLQRDLPMRSGISGDMKRYGVDKADIYLNADLSISSDDINAQFAENTLHKEYENSFNLRDSNFYGNGHTITIEQGQRKIYSLFGDIRGVADDFFGTISDLSLVYDGDVYGAGFAHGIYQHGRSYGTEFDIHNINITVHGNVLPLSTQYLVSIGNDRNTTAEAAGFALVLDGTAVKDVSLHVQGDIGSLDPKKYEHAETELLFSRSSGFTLDRNLRGHEGLDGEKMQNIQNVTIEVDGSILAVSQHFRAEATGLGHDLQEKKYHGIALKVGGDIKAVTEGESLFHKPYEYSDFPLIACAAGQDLHHIEDAVFEIQGSIIAENHGNLGVDVHAMGLGDYDYLNDMSKAEVQKYPLTLQDIKLTVGGDIQAKSTAQEYKLDARRIQTVACAGLFNNTSDNLEHYDTFQRNQIRVNGSIVAEGQEEISIAMFWGFFIGNDNQFSAKSLVATSKVGTVYAAPFYQFVKGQRNTISLSDLVAEGGGGNAAGFAIAVTQFDGAVDHNEISVQRIHTDGVANVGGFAVSIKKHASQPTIEAELRNIDLVLNEIVIKNPPPTASVGGFVAYNQNQITNCTVTCENISVSDTYSGRGDADGQSVGGFVGQNVGEGNISSSTANLNRLIVTGLNYIGGFVGDNEGSIDESFANLHDIAVDDRSMSFSNGQFIGGFEGYGDGGSIANSAAFIQGSILAENVEVLQMGGFSGISSGERHDNNAVQVGKNISSLNNHAELVGGYAGSLGEKDNRQSLVSRSTVLVFGNIEIVTDLPQVVYWLGGFTGSLTGAAGKPDTAVIKDSASFVGGELKRPTPSEYKVGMLSAAVCQIDDGTLSGFTVLGFSEKGGPGNQAYQTLIDDTSSSIFQDNYFVEVKGTGRTAMPITLSKDGKFQQGAEIGKVDIAPRVLQADYWGKDAAEEKVTAPYADFAYVTKKTDGIALQAIANGAETISKDAFTTASLPDFHTRHLALWSGSDGVPGPVYDILGIEDAPEQTATVTFRISNGVWKDGTNADKQLVIPLTDGKGTLGADSVPTGMKANSGYGGGEWDKQPITAADAVIGNVMYIYSFRRDGGHGGSGGHSGSTRYTLTYVSNGGTEYKDESYESGTTVKLDKTPTREGYIFTGWYSDKKLTDKINNIKMTGNKTVYANWEKAEAELHIPDMLNGNDHFAYVTGYTDGTVRPNSKITRAEVAMIFYRLLKEDVRAKNESNRNTFDDVTEDMWFNTAVSTIARLGIVQGRSAESFDPDVPITRAEFATICARFDRSQVEYSGGFSDIHGHWAEKFIKRAAALGWVNGYADGTFRPYNFITRAEAMAMINRVLGRLPETEQDLLPGMKAWPDNADSSAWYYLTVQEATNSHTFERKADGVHERWIKLK